MTGRTGSLTEGPVTPEDFAPLMAAFEPFETNPMLAVGVSGGRDSLALALLADDWARARQGTVVALIVDHGLRAESAAEARRTARQLEHLGIAADVLRWSDPKPSSGVQEAARDARYRLMFEACRARDILHLLVAHQADDQAETIAMRAARASGPDGLAGMAALVEHRDGRLLRPLLSVPRRRLTGTLEARGLSWIDDPSNSDPRFERARLRQGADLPMAAADAAASRAKREGRLAEVAVAILEFDETGEAAFDRSVFADLEQVQGARLLGRLIQAVGGRNYPPRRDRLNRAADRLSQAMSDEQSGRGKSGKSRDFTLSECRLMLRQAPASRRLRWIVRPENGRKERPAGGQPLIPAEFFACGAGGTPHLDE